MNEIGKLIMQRSRYAMKKMGEIPGVTLPFSRSPHFKEFVVNFDRTGKRVKEINRRLLKDKIFGGLDLSEVFPENGQSALFSINETHTYQDIGFLVERLREAVS
jgi:glycine dehydrogenase subunit 1